VTSGTPANNRCLEPDEVERLAGGSDLGTTLAAHASGCPTCMEAVDEARSCNEFLSNHAGSFREAFAHAAGPEPTVPGYSGMTRVEAGGQGVVYKAVQSATHRAVAVKMLRDGALASPRQRFRFERETELLAALNHPNIVTIFDKGRTPDGRDYLVMEWINGAPLDVYMKVRLGRDVPEGQRRLRAKVALFAKIAHAIQHAHGASVIHRDLKPSNVIVDDAGEPHIIDFGLAKPERGSSGPLITATEEFAGTRAYASPEQVTGAAGRMRVTTDVYSLGVMLYEALTGRFPYPVNGPAGAVDGHIRFTDAASLRSVDGDVPSDVETIILKALSKDPERRYQAAGMLAADLDDYIAGRAISARRDSVLYVLRKAASRHRGSFAAVVLFVVLVSAFAVSMTMLAGRLSQQRRTAEAALAVSTIQRGRLVGSTGDTLQAEALLWPQLLRAGGHPADPHLGFTSSPEVMGPAWALFEVYSREPRLMNARTGHPLQLLAISPDNMTVSGVSLPWDAPRSEWFAGAWSIKDGMMLSKERQSPLSGLPATGLCSLDSGAAVFREGSSLRAFDLETGRPITSCSVDDQEYVNAVISPDRATLATQARDGAVQLWDAAQEGQRFGARLALGRPGRPALPRPGDLGMNLAGLCYSPDSRLLADWYLDTLRIWSVRSHELVRELRAPSSAVHGPNGDALRPGCFSPDARWLAALVNDNILLWSLESDKEPRILSGHTGVVMQVVFSSDSSQLLTASMDKTVRLWDVGSGQTIRTIGVQPNNTRQGVALSPDGRLAAATDASFRLSVWETKPRLWLTLKAGAQESATCVCTSADSLTTVSGDERGNITIWDAKLRRPVRVIPSAHHGAVYSVDCSRDAEVIVSLGADGIVNRFGIAPGVQPTVVASGLGSGWGSVRLSPDARVVAATDNNNSLGLWDARTGEQIAHVTDTAVRRIPEIAFSPDGRTIATAAWYGQPALWAVEPLHLMARLEGHGAAVRAVRFSPDGSELATGGDDATIRLWSVAKGRLLRTLKGANGDVFALAFHPEGRLVFSAGRDKAIQVWDSQSCQELATLEGHADAVYSMAMAHDGRTLATASKDGRIGFWDLCYYQAHIRGNALCWSGPETPP
jgi:WD40 repeat protein/tRNA A-37 threonylcarbamoyl transferase component Bud32